MTNPLLSIRHMKKSYGSVTALNDVSIDFFAGEFIVVIGPSGAGKSTFIRCINQLVPITSGSIVFDGVPLHTLSSGALRKQRAKIGMIFQHYNLVGRTNVIKNVLHGRLAETPLYKSLFGRYTDADKQEAVQLLTKVGLAEHMYKRADALSGGQMQRVGICRAILQRPKLLLADEPIASLDPRSAMVVMQQLKDISQEKHLTCIVNLHQVDFARQFATRIVGIKDGKIVFDGPPVMLTEDIVNDIYKGKEEQMTLPNAKHAVEEAVTIVQTLAEKEYTSAGKR